MHSGLEWDIQMRKRSPASTIWRFRYRRHQLNGTGEFALDDVAEGMRTSGIRRATIAQTLLSDGGPGPIHLACCVRLRVPTREEFSSPDGHLRQGGTGQPARVDLPYCYQ